MQSPISKIRRWRPALAFASLALAAGLLACGKKSTSPTNPNPTPNPTPPPGMTIGLRLVKSGLDQPLFLTGSPGDTSRLFVLEKGGDVRVIKSGNLLTTPFLSVPVATSGEMGLAGMAFDPGYATNGRFYLSFLDPSGDTKLIRYTVSSNRDVANPSGQTI
ncbi:MAG TPA: PQQ-dependent sugar dehydrogenase, partial [Candidatus Eisenbacteria bacterium]|nr:PQQ-dependent sugar dehydrogenase [Candidatus Eisenbacteria bacterium]